VGPPGPKFINVGSDVQQGVDYQCAKFRCLLITCQRHICCWSLSISLIAWPTKRPVSTYHAAATKA